MRFRMSHGLPARKCSTVAAGAERCRVRRDEPALVNHVYQNVETVQALFRDRWKRDKGRKPGPLKRLKRLVLGTSPRARYEEATEFVTLRDALIELIVVLEGKPPVTEAQRKDMRRISQEIDRWSPRGGAEQRPDLEELWQMVCDVECITIELADGSWLDRRLEREASHSSDGPSTSTGGDATDRDGATRWRGQKRQRSLDSVRHRLLDQVRDRARSARQRRGYERVRAERLMSAGVLAFPAAILTAGCFAWAVYWQGGAGSGPGYVSVRSALAVFAGALGSALARVLRLRNATLGTLEDDRFRRAFIVQMVLGGAFGVLALVLVEVGAVPRVGSGGDVAMVALYAFLAGWSEPFIVGVLDRLASGEGGQRRPTGRPEAGDAANGRSA